VGFLIECSPIACASKAASPAAIMSNSDGIRSGAPKTATAWETAKPPKSQVITLTTGKSETAHATTPIEAGGRQATGGQVSPRLNKCTVVLPKSMDELRHIAALNFDKDGRFARLRMFHKGRELLQPSGLQCLSSGDEVVVKLMQPPGQEEKDVGARRFVSTSRADFVRHPFESKASQSAGDDQMVFAFGDDPPATDQKSSYAHSYVQHDIQPVTAATRLGASRFSRHFMHHGEGQGRATSMYADSYKGHRHVESPRVDFMSKTSVFRNPEGTQLDTTSVYQEAFVQHKQPDRPKTSPALALSSWKTSAGNEPLEGLSVYGSTFVKHPLSARTPSLLDSRPRRKEAFDGVSEYRRMYKGADAERPFLRLSAVVA